MPLGMGNPSPELEVIQYGCIVRGLSYIFGGNVSLAIGNPRLN